MKTANAEVKTADFRIWCEHCSIRIAPHEEKVAVDGKTYHQRCYPKYCEAISKARAASYQSTDVIGDDR
jgi:hypothetical protein